MKLYQKIDKILTEEVIKSSDFMKTIGLSKSAFYSIKNGITKKLSEDTAKKINEKFPKYSYKWLVEAEIKKSNTTGESYFYVSEGKISLKEFALIAAQNINELKKQPIFYNTFVMEALNLIQEVQNKDGSIDPMKIKTKE